MALNAQGTRSKIEEALHVLHEASCRDPKNPQLLFQQAHILFARDDIEAALSALELVVVAAPKEPPVHAMMGQIYQRLGMISKAMYHLNIALDLDPKEANNIKVIICLFMFNALLIYLSMYRLLWIVLMNQDKMSYRKVSVIVNHGII